MLDNLTANKTNNSQDRVAAHSFANADSGGAVVDFAAARRWRARCRCLPSGAAPEAQAARRHRLTASKAGLLKSGALSETDLVGVAHSAFVNVTQKT